MDERINYFTCTLGEAAILNASLTRLPDGEGEGVGRRRDGSSGWKTINEFVDFLADNEGDRVAVGIGVPSKGMTEENVDGRWGTEVMTFAQIEQKSIAISHWLQQRFDDDQGGDGDGGECRGEGKESAVALLADSSLIFLLFWLAIIRLDRPVLLIAPQCNRVAIRHLLHSCDARYICHDEKHQKVVESICSSTEKDEGRGDGQDGQQIKSILFTWSTLAGIDLPSSRLSPSPSPRPVRQCDNDRIAFYFHSSGTSTGLPKPIPQTHHGAVGVLPRLLSADDGSTRLSTFTTTPLYHGGIADLLRAWSAASTLWLFPEHQAPIHGKNILAALQPILSTQRLDGRLGYVSCVPYVLQMMAEEPELLGCLKEMEIVGVGGAALPTELGDRLVDGGVSLVSRFGSAECGFLLSSHRRYHTDNNWQYLRLAEGVGSISFEPISDGQFELVVSDRWPLLSPPIRSKLPFHTSDLFEVHPSIPHAWKYLGRSDSQLTLLTGKKFDPSTIESTLVLSDSIKDVIVIGDGRLCPAALIFLSESAEAIESEEQQQQMVWTAVRDVNRNGPAHAQIRKDMIRVQSSAHSSRLEKSSKGTIMRGRVMTEFSAEIESLYADPVQTMKDGRRLEAEPLDTILKVVSDIVSAHLQVEHVSPDTDLYHEGVSSSGCMQIRNQLRLQLSTGAAAKMSPNVVYESGSIRGLAVYIRELAHFVQGSQTGGNGDFKMMQMAQKHVAGQLRMLEEMQAAGHVILLTGATGSLGVHLLDQLLDTRGVEQIVLLIRAPHDHRIANSSEACRQRVESVLREHGMAPLGRKCAPVVICFPAELDSSTLGLSTSDRDRLMEKVTHIIHAAWAVNFNLPLKTFEANIAGVVNLYNLARLAGKRQRRAVSYVFCSSVASVMNAGGVGQPGDGDHSTAVGIKETTSDRPSDASSLGYSQSKWVAERILADLPNAATVPKDLKEQFPFPHHGYVSISILRIGQLCGDTYRSAWNMREAWPLMLDVGLRVMPLPQIPDLNAASLGILGWLPVNLAARAVLEISIGQFGQRRPEGGNLEVFHLVSTDERTDWAMAQNWLATMEFKDRKTEGLETGAPRGKVQIVPATQWLEELESLAVDHPAKNLLGLWTEGWTAGSPSAVAAAEGSGTGADREDARPVVRFETERAREASETMRDGEGMRVDKDRFEGMVRWVLAEGRRLGFGSGKE